jgi:8-oxo-dGTP pyrophosphatase MutT (NUDIX family)
MNNEKNLKKHCSAVFLYIFNREGTKLLLIKRNEEKRKKWGFDWGAIGGKIELGESPKEAIVREAKEEIGLEINSKEIKPLFIKDIKKDNENIKHFFYSTKIDESSNVKLNGESEEYRWFDLDNFPKSMTDDQEHMKKVLKLFKTE